MGIKIANAAGFLGDQLDAPRRLVEAAEVDYLTLEYLAELTMSILARQREKDPARGYAADFIDVLESLCPAMKDQPPLRIVTNAGGVNPRACAAAAGRVLSAAGLGDRRIAVVTGDCLRAELDTRIAGGCLFEHFDTGEPLGDLRHQVVSANAYLGAPPIAEALDREASIVMTGRVADASLAVGPAIHEFKWAIDDWDRLAGASLAGHLIECGAQVTGGYAPMRDGVDLASLGYPIAEVEPDGTCVITKPPASGGVVDRRTVTSQLLYEIGDPAHYLTPDVDLNMTTVDIRTLAPDRVRVGGATGNPAPEHYKVSLAYRNGYAAAGQVVVYGRDCLEKARASAEILLRRVRAAGFELQETHVELLGAGAAVPGLHSPPPDLREVMLRVSVRATHRAAAERFTKEWAPLITSGPAGLAGYTALRGSVRPVYAYWPTLIPKDTITPTTHVRTASDWASD